MSRITEDRGCPTGQRLKNIVKNMRTCQPLILHDLKVERLTTDAWELGGTAVDIDSIVEMLDTECALGCRPEPALEL